MKIKICGIKNYESAKACIEYGADFLGFNFVQTSKRYTEPQLARNIIIKLPKSIAKVGVFMDAEIKDVNYLIDFLKLDYVQLHGNESLKYLENIKNAGIIKTFSLPSEFDVEKTIQQMRKYSVEYYLLDREKQGMGKLLNLDKVRNLTDNVPIILAGGLTEENISQVIRLARPQVIDVAGGVEANGKKDKNMIKKFIESVFEISR